MLSYVMPNFKTHSFFGFSIGTGLAFLAVAHGWLSAVRGLLAAVIFTLASLLPDLDSDTGTAKRFLFESLSVLIPAAVISQSSIATAEQAFLVITVLYFCIRCPCEFFFERFTRHRGIFHSIPMAVVFGAGTLLIFHNSTEQVRFLYAGACTAGYMLHLILDELRTLFSTGKESGGALKMRSDSAAATILTYLAAAVLLAAAFFPRWRDSIL